jgi:putative membrane protein insertion efficiency factor
MDYQKRENVKIEFLPFLQKNGRYLRKKCFYPLLKAICMRAIIFYQKHISKHTCLYRPTCSQYTLECINNHGAIIGILLGCFRILRCNPFAKGGYDPAPENYFRKKWLL